jgi:hypothetical protein
MTNERAAATPMNPWWVLGGAATLGIVNLGMFALSGNLGFPLYLATIPAVVLLALLTRKRRDFMTGVVAGFGVLTLISLGTCTITGDTDPPGPPFTGYVGYPALLGLAALVVLIVWLVGRNRAT